MLYKQWCPRTVAVLLRAKVMTDGRNPTNWNIRVLACHRKLFWRLFHSPCCCSGTPWRNISAAGVTPVFMFLPAASYAPSALTATLHYNRPYQTPPTILTRTLITHIAQPLSARCGSTTYLTGIYSHSFNNLKPMYAPCGARGITDCSVVLQFYHRELGNIACRRGFVCLDFREFSRDFGLL